MPQYYYRARYYDPGRGTFINEDPSHFQGGDTNFYRYVGNSPTGDSDPSGELAPLWFVGAALFALFIPDQANAPGPNEPLVGGHFWDSKFYNSDGVQVCMSLSLIGYGGWGGQMPFGLATRHRLAANALKNLRAYHR